MDQFTKIGLPALAGLALIAGIALQSSGSEGSGLALLLSGALLACTAVTLRSARWGTLASATVALGANLYLFQRKFEAARDTEAICNVNDVINCDAVNSSAASEMFGVPITLLGAGFYAGLSVAAFLAKDDDDRFFQTSGLFALVNLLYSAYLGFVAAQIGAVCMLCISIYVANGLLLWAAIKGMGETGGHFSKSIGGVFGSTSFLAITLVFGGTVLAGGSAWQTEQARLHNSTELDTERPALPTAELERVFHAPGGTVRLDGTEPIYGDPDAPYMIVEWADYGCPHCARAAVELKRIVNENPQIQLRFKVYPLDGACNESLQPGDGTRCRAAKAAECGQRQGRFWEMQGLLFKNQGYFADDELRHMAKQAGLDVAAYDTCMEDPSADEGVKADADAGREAKIFGTPTLFLQGTHGSEFVQAEGIPGALRLIEAHSGGMTMPEPPPFRMPAGMH
ncbi:MAG: thioredoxin domain-containing protein [Proteobacteria bacterium]|nr:thioredoxin domain-containing protein [Pseudomonadota bacterium]